MSRTGLRDLPAREVLVGGRPVAVRVRKSSRARRARLTVRPDRPVELVLPRGAGPEAIDAILADKRAWLEDTLAWAEALASRPPALGLDRSGWIPIDGTWLRVVRVGGATSAARRSGGSLLVSGRPESLAAAIDRWYRREARRTIEGVVLREAAHLGVHPGPISIRDPVTRWGSCSSTGRMSFSWRLLLTPPAVLDYVVVHELCHLRHPNHSQRFWAMVSAARPGWREQVGWLEQHGPEVLAYRSSG